MCDFLAIKACVTATYYYDGAMLSKLTNWIDPLTETNIFVNENFRHQFWIHGTKAYQSVLQIL